MAVRAIQQQVFDTFHDVPLRQDFARHLVGELGDAASTAWTYEQCLRRLERFMDRSIRDVTATDVRRFFRDSDYHPSTKNQTLVGLKSWVRFLRLEKAIDPEVAADILALKGPKPKRRMRRPMTCEEVCVVLDACRRPNEYRAVYPGCYQGMRVSDSANLRKEHFRGDRLMFTSMKGDKDLELPLHSEVARMKDFILQSNATRDSLKAACYSLAHYTGIPFTSHTLRHTFARRHDDLGTQEGVVIELLGQEQVTVYRRHYAAVSWDAMAEAQLKFSYLKG